MNCPKCGFVQPDGMPDCQRCQVIFAKWQARQTQAAETMALPEAVPPSLQRPAAPPPLAAQQPAANAGAPAAPPNDYLPQYTYIPPGRSLEPDAPKRNWGMLAALLAGALLVVWVAKVIFIPGKGLPVPEGAYRDPGRAFAITPPGDWTSLTPENFQEMAGRHGSSIPADLKQVMGSDKFKAYFIKLTPGRVGGDNLNITTYDKQMPRLSESDRQDAEKQITTAYGQQFSGFKINHSEIIQIDRLQALRIASEASIYDPGTRMNVSVQFVQAMVPGSGRTYILTCTTDAGANSGTDCNPILDSFRVLKRPTWAGGSTIFSGALKGGLIGAVIGLAVGFIKWIFGGGE